MAIKLTTTIGNFTVEVEGETQLEAFDNMAEMAELLSVGVHCGKSGATDTIPVRRMTGDFIFREWKCVSSGATLGMGQKKEGGLFPRRKDKEGNWLEDNGWQTWAARKKEMQPANSNSGGDEEWGGF